MTGKGRKGYGMTTATATEVKMFRMTQSSGHCNHFAKSSGVRRSLHYPNVHETTNPKKTFGTHPVHVTQIRLCCALSEGHCCPAIPALHVYCMIKGDVSIYKRSESRDGTDEERTRELEPWNKSPPTTFTNFSMSRAVCVPGKRRVATDSLMNVFQAGSTSDTHIVVYSTLYMLVRSIWMLANGHVHPSCQLMLLFQLGSDATVSFFALHIVPTLLLNVSR